MKVINAIRPIKLKKNAALQKNIYHKVSVEFELSFTLEKLEKLA